MWPFKKKEKKAEARKKLWQVPKQHVVEFCSRYDEAMKDGAGTLARAQFRRFCNSIAPRVDELFPGAASYTYTFKFKHMAPYFDIVECLKEDEE